ncbi:unnamed protein product [Soboliphyme baturini]|uniref:Fibrous sheath-interacting protein 1 n=1 Tax=Soboliphyme baturini TaxID=241478 RepID=A0A183J925_9BILA|nr:unnamed protein product [Soboliphyme baturini]
MADDEIFELYTRSQDCSVVSRSERCCLQNDDGVPSAAAGSGSFVQVRLMEELKLALRAKSDEMHSREEKALLRLKLRSGDKRIKEDEGLVQHQSPKGESIRSPLAESTTKESDGVTDAYPETGLPRSIVYRKEMEVDGNDGEDRSHASSFRGLLVAELNARFERDENYGDSVGDVGVCDTSPLLEALAASPIIPKFLSSFELFVCPLYGTHIATMRNAVAFVFDRLWLRTAAC